MDFKAVIGRIGQRCLGEICIHGWAVMEEAYGECRDGDYEVEWVARQ